MRKSIGVHLQLTGVQSVNVDVKWRTHSNVWGSNSGERLTFPTHAGTATSPSTTYAEATELHHDYIRPDL